MAFLLLFFSWNSKKGWGGKSMSLDSKSRESTLATTHSKRTGRLHLNTDLHLARKFWHFSTGGIIVAIYAAGLPKSSSVLILSACLALCILMEYLRLKNRKIKRMALKVWAPLMRRSELYRFSGTPFYLAAALLAVGVFPKTIAILSILYLACGDPIASIVGILYGGKKYRFESGKSLIGALAASTVCFLITLVVLAGLPIPMGQILLLALIGGIAGGGAELLPLDIDDNFSIPMVSGFALWLAFITLGI